jgi:hypothetical protein
VLLARAWPALLACGCFVDPGTASTGPSSTTGGSSSGDVPATTTTGALTTSSADPTTTTTDAITTTTAATTTTATTTAAGTTTSVDATSAADTTTSDDTTTAPSEACATDHTVVLDLKDAQLSGGAAIIDLFGFLLATGKDEQNQVAWTFELPCSAAWFVWVHYYEEAGPDTYTVGFDAGADDDFDAGCFDVGAEEMLWAVLNRRPKDEFPCTALEDPYTPALAAGVHELRVGLAKGKHLGSVVLTTDPNYSPD